MLAFNFLLPAAALHAHAGRLAELGRARDLRRRRDRRERSHGPCPAPRRGGGAAGARGGIARGPRDVAPRRTHRSSGGARGGAERAADVLGVESCAHRSRARGVSRRRGESPYDLEVEGVRVGTLYLREGPRTADRDAQTASSPRSRRCSPWPSSATSSSREAVEAEALRRSDTVKTSGAALGEPRPPLTAHGHTRRGRHAPPLACRPRARRSRHPSRHRLTARPSASTASCRT